MDRKFTPGPWEVVSDPCHYHTLTEVVAGCRDDGTSMVVEVGGDASIPELEANARLIASSPVMYEALREAVLQIEYLHDKFQETGTGNAVLAKLKAALAKSGGE